MRVARGGLSRRDFLGRAAALGIAAPAAAAFLSACARDVGPNKGSTLVLALAPASASDSLDPALIIDFNHSRVWGETLTETNPTDGSIVPALAESFDPRDGGRQWQFKLRRGVTFHDGRSMTSDDVVKTLQRHSGPRSRSGALGVMRSIESIAADGPHAVLITLKEPNADFPYLMSDYHLIIQPGGGFAHPAAGIATGPYRIEVFEPGVRLAAVKFRDHWRREVGHADSIEILMINDSTARISALQSGRAHLINLVEPKIVRFVQDLPGVVVKSTRGGGHYMFAARCDQPPLDNADLRLALKYAVDRDEMVKRILYGFGTVGNDHPVNASYPMFDESIEQRCYDPERAAFHYEHSGHSGPIVLTVAEAAFPGSVNAAALYREHAARCGIDIRIQRAPDDGYWTNVWGQASFCASNWGCRPTQDQIFSVAYKSDADWNHTKWRRPDFDALLVRARGETDPGVRKQLYGTMARRLRDDGGAIIPMFNDFIDAMSSRIGGYVQDPGGEISNGFAAIRCWLNPAAA
jgi:peptide/nickel transport system substrate-binding protein